MFEIELIKTPPLTSPPEILEQACCGIISKIREGKQLPPEVLDWMDAANNVLDSF